MLTMEFQPIIMAAGRGSRMTEIIAKTPKALLPVGNKPMVWYPIKMLEKAGFEEAIIIVQRGHRKSIERVLVDELQVNVKLEFVSIPDEEDWGTADSLRFIRDKIKTDVLVVSSDLISDVSVQRVADVHRAHDATLTMLLSASKDYASETIAVPGPKSKKKSEVEFVGLESQEHGNRLLFLSSEADFEENITFRKSIFRKHPCIDIRNDLVDGHLYLLKKWVVDFLHEHKSVTTVKGELLPYLVKKQFSQKNNGIHAIEENINIAMADSPQKGDGRDLYDYGEEDELCKLAREWSTWNDHSGDMAECYHGNKIRCYGYVMDDGLLMRVNNLAAFCDANRQASKFLSEIAGKELANIHPQVNVPQKAQVGTECMVGEWTNVGEKVTIKKSFIGKHCNVSEKVRMTNCIVMNHVTVSESCNAQGCVIGDNVHIGENTDLKDCIILENVAPSSKLSNEVIGHGFK
ncbi:translation initiation factor eIF2B subunit gamma-like [Tubulanus polymorphus]|uniref:translation initiation factor eIF2B subunit gamma-like n=1 Tax=Tubulanus polymorphus TaxID=672921 RepID=UPI003DA2DEE9